VAVLTVDGHDGIGGRCDELARYLADSGRVIPGLSVDDRDRARSWWWPMPAARDRSVVASLCDDSSFEAQRAAARLLAEATDGIVRARLVEAGTSLVARRSGRRSVEAAWLLSLTAPDPWLPGSLDTDKLRALETEVAQWVGSGAAALGSIRVCLRVHEPERADGDWNVELLAQDTVEASLVVPAIDVWRGQIGRASCRERV
jgi:hypothetical protein